MQQRYVAIGLVGWDSPADVIGFSCLSHKGYEQVRERIPKIHGLILFGELSELRMGRELEAPATIGSNGLNFFRATHLFAHPWTIPSEVADATRIVVI